MSVERKNMNDKRVNQYLILPEAGQRKDTKLAVEHSEEQISEMLKQGYAIVNHDDLTSSSVMLTASTSLLMTAVFILNLHLQTQSCWLLQSLPKSQSLRLSVTAKRLSRLPTTETAMTTMTRQGSVSTLPLSP